MLDRSNSNDERTTPVPPAQSPGVPGDRPALKAAWRPSPDLGRVLALINALPEAVLVMESDGELRLTNPAADRLFADLPVVDRADLLSRFEEIGPDDPQPTPLRGDTNRSVTIRPRGEPNRWFALRSVSLDGAAGGNGVAAAAGSAGPASAPTGAETGWTGVMDPGATGQSESTPAGARDMSPGRTAYVLRDVTDSRDMRPAREAFLSVLSHELRTPITTIFAGSSVLARRPSLSPPATQTLARDISSEAARLYDLVEDLLVLARLERRILDPLDEPVLLQRSVDTTIRMIGDRVTGARIERRGDPDPPPVHGDATYVEQACRDLILAAIRFGGEEPGQELVVELRSDPEAGEVTVAVLDRGPQLPAEDLELAFELPDSSAIGRLAGSGVGAFVTRHLVEAMGGRTWATNRPEGGLEMGFALRVHGG